MVGGKRRGLGFLCGDRSGGAVGVGLVRFEVAQDLLPPPDGSFASCGDGALEAVADVVRDVSRRLREALAHFLVRRVDGSRDPDHYPGHDLAPALHLALPLRYLLAAEEGAYAARDPCGRGGDLDHAAAHPLGDHRGRLVQFSRHAGHVPDGLIELGELAVDVVYRDVRLPEKRHDLFGDVVDRPLCGREDPCEPEEHPREHEERDRDPREEYSLHQLNESMQALPHLPPENSHYNLDLRVATSHDATPDDPLPVSCIEHRRLPRRDARDRLLELRDPLAARVPPRDFAGYRRAVVADLHEAGILGIQEPVHLPYPHLPHLEVPPASHHDLVGLGAHLRHVERRRSGDAYAAPLADCEVHNALVPPENRSLSVHDITGLRRHLLANEAAVVAVRDKADVLALWRVSDSEAPLLGDPAHLGLAVLAEREDRALQ